MPDEIVSSQLAFAYVTSVFMQWLKYQKWFPLLQSEARILNRLVAAVAAFIVAIGIHWTFDSTQGTLVITGLTTQGIMHALSAWVQQFAFQQAAYKSLVAEKNGVSTITTTGGTKP